MKLSMYNKEVAFSSSNVQRRSLIASRMIPLVICKVPCAPPPPKTLYAPKLGHWAFPVFRKQSSPRCNPDSLSRTSIKCAARIQNRELVVGDLLCLVCFCLYKQITALILLPTFPGWLEPLSFNPVRFFEFFSFTATLCGTWFACAWLLGGYRTTATADLQTAVRCTILIWLLSEPVAAAQLVLLTAAEGEALVGMDGFAAVLPLAASGPGEPFVTAAGVLGLMAVWRTFYAAYLDFWNIQSLSGSPLNRYDDMRNFVESLRVSMFISIIFCVIVQFLGQFVGEEQVQLMLDMAFQQPSVFVMQPTQF